MTILNDVSDENQFFVDPSDGTEHPFDSLWSLNSLHLSIIVPAYNEESRLPTMLDEALTFLLDKENSTDGFTFEIIIVDDGSVDGTSQTALNYAEVYGIQKIRLLKLKQNRGKGAAVKEGVLRARGQLIIFADADGATKFSDYDSLENQLKEQLCGDFDREAIAIGSRAHLEKDSVVQRSFFRTVLMYGFHFLVWLFCVRSVKDTQCGFKLFTRRAALLLFPNLHVERWAFDVELLYVAERLDIPIAEIPVNWTEIEGSKLTPFWTSLQMGRDLFLIWLWYFLGVWNYQNYIIPEQ